MRFITILFLFSSTLSFAQGVAPGGAGVTSHGNLINRKAWNDFMNKFDTDNSYQRIEDYYATIDGSPYLLKKYVPADVYLPNGEGFIQDVNANFDTYQNGIVAFNKEGKIILLDAKYYDKVVLHTPNYDMVFGKPNTKLSDRFYQILYTKDGYTLYKEVKAYVQEGKNIGIKSTNSRFGERVKYYVINDNEEPQSIRLKRKEVLKSLPAGVRADAEQIIKEQKLKLKKEKHFRELFQLLSGK